ncbi:MAG: hypothetical protein CMJ48_03580 [Planctomycetaceae bacterium]|nr:hypothetical protein [Planctomycetaceae bacterium]
MRVRRCIVSTLAIAGLVAAGSLALTGAPLPKETVKPGSAQEIAQDWRYNPNAKETSWQGVSPKGARKLHAQMGKLTGASFEHAWNFYAQKCGSDEKYGQTFYSVGAQSKDGQYVIRDDQLDGRRCTMFAFTNERFSVGVQLRQASDKDKIYIAITVATR